MKDKIIEAAEKLFLTVGYKSVTMDAVANEICVSKKTLYKSYDCKAALVEDVVSGIKKKLFERIDNVFNLNFNPIKENYEIQRIIITVFQYAPVFSRAELMKYYPEIYEKYILSQYPKIIDFLTKNMKRGVEYGSFRSDIDVYYCARLNFLLLSSSDQILCPEIKNIEFVKKIIEYNLRAIATNKGVRVLQGYLDVNLEN